MDKLNSGKENKKILIFDTTLRDGEQTPSVSLNPEDKIRIAKELDDFGVHIIEAGMAITSKGEREAIKAIAHSGLHAKIYNGCRIRKTEIDLSLDLDVDGVQIIVPTSKLHQNVKLGKTREEINNMVTEVVEYAKDHGLEVGVSAEDASRTEINYLKQFYNQLQKLKCDRVCYCDTVGILTPEKTFLVIKELTSNLSIPLGIHCHDDFGLATTNTIFAIKAGAMEFHSTINGVGERSGNAATEEIIMALRQLYDLELKVKYTKLFSLSRLVSNLMAVPVQPNKAIIGGNSFTHESGIHTDGMMKDFRMYEPFPPEIIGRKRRYIIGKHSGKKIIENSLKELGIELKNGQLITLVEKVKSLAEKEKTVTEADLVALAYDIIGYPQKEYVKLDELTVVTGNKITPFASVHIQANNRKYVGSGTGVGPVDAAVNAIKNVTGMIMDIKLVNYEVKSITGGTNALVDVSITLSKGDIERKGRGVSEDIIAASVFAYLSALNQILLATEMNNDKKS
ncbi:MAG: 2-isopropylmalate synthase [Candidatus Odinarchaeia archaeon]